MGFKLPKIKNFNPLNPLSGAPLPRQINYGFQRHADVLSDPGGEAKKLFKDPKGQTQEFLRNQPGFFGRALAPMLDKDVKPKAGEDPTVTALRDRLYGEAADFTNQLPGMVSSAHGQIDKEGDLAMKSGIKSTRQNYNRRGLLYSGLREGGEQGVRGQVASKVSEQKGQANKDLAEMAKAKWNTVAQAGLQGYQDAVNKEAEIAGISLQNQVARAQAMQQLGSTVGYGAGTYMNYRQSNPSQPTGNYSQQFRQGNLAADSTPYFNYNSYGTLA